MDMYVLVCVCVCVCVNERASVYVYAIDCIPGLHTCNCQRFTHFDVREEALMLKKVALTWLATHLPAVVVHAQNFS